MFTGQFKILFSIKQSLFKDCESYDGKNDFPGSAKITIRYYQTIGDTDKRIHH